MRPSNATERAQAVLYHGLESAPDRHVVSDRVAPGRGAQLGHGRSLGVGGSGASGSSAGSARSGLSGSSGGSLSRRDLPASQACFDGDRTQ